MTDVASEPERIAESVSDLEPAVQVGPPARTVRRTLVSIAALLLALTTGVAIGVLIPILQRPGDESAEAGFARDMQTHHTQAVEMSMVLYGRSTDAELKTIAWDIALTQQAQIGIMSTWLANWHLSPTGPGPAMAWMNTPPIHGEKPMAGAPMTVNADGLMPGMASAAELNQLRTASSPQLDILYCQLMIRHHLGGITMIDGILARTDRSEVRELAEPMRTSQRLDITGFTDIQRRLATNR